MHYYGIVDSPDEEWYDAVLDECKSLDINDFLHDFNLYVTNRPLPPYCAPATIAVQSAPSTSASPVRFVESDIFESALETRCLRYPNISKDELYLGTSFRQGGGRFNQFRSMEGAISGSDFLNNPGPSTLDGIEPASLSRGYESQQRRDAGVPRSSHVASQTRLQRFKQGDRSTLRAAGDQLHPAMVPTTTAVGGGNIGPTNALSLDAWSGHSSPHDIGDGTASAPPQREPREDDRSQLKCTDMIMDDPPTEGDHQSDAEAPARPSSNVASVEAAVVPSTVIVVGLGAVNDSVAGGHDVEKQEDDTSEGSKKKKEPVFIHGVELVDLHDCDVPDKRLQCDNEDTDEEEALNLEEMDVDEGVLLGVQTDAPSSCIASAPDSASVPIRNDPLIESAGGLSDPFFNAIGKALHPDAVIVKQEAGWFQLKEAKRVRKTT
jgi:hypothetical protein